MNTRYVVTVHHTLNQERITDALIMVKGVISVNSMTDEVVQQDVVPDPRDSAVVIGNIEDGFSFFGPATSEEAGNYAGDNTDAKVVELIPMEDAP
jgi:hypothetical protein